MVFVCPALLTGEGYWKRDHELSWPGLPLGGAAQKFLIFFYNLQYFVKEYHSTCRIISHHYYTRRFNDEKAGSLDIHNALLFDRLAGYGFRFSWQGAGSRTNNPFHALGVSSL
jgi:hypothetical protein